jgi:hypothetical protein
MSAQRNEYRCALEINQNGKYTVRIQAAFGRKNWPMPVYFLASSFDAAIKKIEQSLQLLQRHEDRLWFWGVERSDDPNLAEELLSELGLHRDRRTEFPPKSARLSLSPERPVSAFQLASFRRTLAASIFSGRVAAASD